MKSKDLIRRPIDLIDNRLGGRLFDMMDSLGSMIDLMHNDFETYKFLDIQPKGSFPKINVAETDEGYEIDIAVAGFEKDEVELEIKNNSMLIKAECSEEKSDETKKYLFKEIASRSFRRAIRFPDKINTDGVSCKHDNGIIKCVVPKQKADADSTIKIKID